MRQLNELRNSFLEEFESALILLDHGKHKSVTILLSKALFALTDFLIFQEYSKLPKNHGERFRILEEKEPRIYKIVDQIWETYTDAYSKPALRESIDLLIKAIKRITENDKRFDEKIEEIVKRS